MRSDVMTAYTIMIMGIAIAMSCIIPTISLSPYIDRLFIKQAQNLKLVVQKPE
jgi:hypothetical protein